MIDKTVQLSIFFTLFISMSISAQSVFGTWKTIDDRTGKPKGLIEIYEKDGLMYGKVVDILEEGKENKVCDKCDGDLKDKPVKGMEIITECIFNKRFFIIISCFKI